jgi:hypothetical protein
VAVEKMFRDDVTGEMIAKGDVIVIRIGTLADRPDACDRLDIGPAAHDYPIADLIAKWREIRKLNEEGDPVAQPPA